VSSEAGMIFATFAEDDEERYQALVLVESLRTFGGRFKDAPAWIWIPGSQFAQAAAFRARVAALDAEVKSSETLEDAGWFYFTGKSFAAGAAEAAADALVDDPAHGGRNVGPRLLVWMDCDTVILKEPLGLALPDRIDLGATPVYHTLIGSAWSQPPDPFWNLVYRKLGVNESAIFRVTAPVDGAMLRAYFNAGLLVVRPERGILKMWAASFEKLYKDPAIVSMCEGNPRLRVFLHQVALAGAILTGLGRDRILLYPKGINYNYFLQDKYPPETRIGSIDDIITLRYDVRFRDPGAIEGLRGSEPRLSWIRERFSPDRYPSGGW
jgi:hypothetical protein